MQISGIFHGACLGLGLVALTAFAVAAQELPSAPSAVLQQEQRRAVPPPAASPAPAQSAQSNPAQASNARAANSAADKSAPPPPAASRRDGPAAQAPGGVTLPANSEETIKVPVNEVSLIFTATDKHGHFIKNLQASDILIRDDHQPVTKFSSFSNETGLPLRVGLLIDASNSIRDRFRFEQQAAIEFLTEIIRPQTDKAFVLGFDTVPEVTQDFTNNTGKLADGLRMLRPGGGTALYDALYYACRDKLLKVAPGQAVRRAIILVSDGDDNQSRVTRQEAIEMAQRAEVIVYTISTNTSGMELRGDQILELIASQTGGRYFAPFKIEDVANAFSEIQEELRSQYAVAYKPPDFKPDGSYRPIEISAIHHSIRIRARKGYYAPVAQ